MFVILVVGYLDEYQDGVPVNLNFKPILVVGEFFSHEVTEILEQMLDFLAAAEKSL